MDRKLLNTPVQMVRNVPYLAMMPLILVWLGIGIDFTEQVLNHSDITVVR